MGEVIIAVVGAVMGVGGLAALLQARSLSRKTNAEAEVTLGTGWRDLWEGTRAEVQSAHAEIVVLKLQLSDVEKREQDCQRRLSRLEVGDRVAVERLVGEMLDRAIEKREGHL